MVLWSPLNSGVKKTHASIFRVNNCMEPTSINDASWSGTIHEFQFLKSNACNFGFGTATDEKLMGIRIVRGFVGGDCAGETFA